MTPKWSILILFKPIVCSTLASAIRIRSWQRFSLYHITLPTMAGRAWQHTAPDTVLSSRLSVVLPSQ